MSDRSLATVAQSVKSPLKTERYNRTDVSLIPSQGIGGWENPKRVRNFGLYRSNFICIRSLENLSKEVIFNYNNHNSNRNNNNFNNSNRNNYKNNNNSSNNATNETEF